MVFHLFWKQFNFAENDVGEEAEEWAKNSHEIKPGELRSYM